MFASPTGVTDGYEDKEGERLARVTIEALAIYMKDHCSILTVPCTTVCMLEADRGYAGSVY
jgi:hypothetical protein